MKLSMSAAIPCVPILFLRINNSKMTLWIYALFSGNYIQKYFKMKEKKHPYIQPRESYLTREEVRVKQLVIKKVHPKKTEPLMWKPEGERGRERPVGGGRERERKRRERGVAGTESRS